MKKPIKKEYEVVPTYSEIKRVQKEPAPEMLWANIPVGSYGLFAGAQKTGKTTFAENLAISLAVGRKSFFGYDAIGRPVKVLFVNLEEDARIWARRQGEQIDSLEEEELELLKQNLLCPRGLPRYILSDDDWKGIEDVIIKSDAEVIFIDSLTHLFGKGKIEDSNAALKFFQVRFDPFLRKLNKTVIVIHHTVKGNQKPMDQYSIAGSRVILQEFQFAIGFDHLPAGGTMKYAVDLFNKFAAVDDSLCIPYTMNENYWVENYDVEGKDELFYGNKIDLREDDANGMKILEYFENQDNQGNQDVTTADLRKEFVESKLLSHETLHVWLKKLAKSKKVVRIKRGLYRLDKDNQ